MQKWLGQGHGVSSRNSVLDFIGYWLLLSLACYLVFSYAQVFQSQASSNQNDASPEVASTLSRPLSASTSVNSLAGTQQVRFACNKVVLRR